MTLEQLQVTGLQDTVRTAELQWLKARDVHIAEYARLAKTFSLGLETQVDIKPVLVPATANWMVLIDRSTMLATEQFKQIEEIAQQIKQVADQAAQFLAQNQHSGQNPLSEAQKASSAIEAAVGRDRETARVAELRLLVRQLLDDGEVLTARRALDAIAPDLLDAGLRRLKAIIAPPRIIRTRAATTSRTRDFDWLKQNAARYRGQWVALKEGELVAARPELRELTAYLRSLSPRVSDPLIHRID